MVRSSIARRLTREGFRVKAFDSAEAVLEELQKETPALVLLDHERPGSKGKQVLVEMEKMGLRIPVVFMTAQKVFFELSPVDYQGPVSMVMKSLELEEIGSLVKTALVV